MTQDISSQSYGVCCQRQFGSGVGGSFGMFPPMFPFLQPAGFPWWQYPYPSPVAPVAPVAPAAPPPVPAAPVAPIPVDPPTTQAPPPSTGSPDNSTSVQKSGCGVGPYKTLSLDEQSRIVGGQDALRNSWPFIVRELAETPSQAPC